MKQLQAELKLAKSTVIVALKVLSDLNPESTSFSFDESLPKEMKAASDKILEEIILKQLRTSGLDILSEEAGKIYSGNEADLRWVVDPLDGTVNFVRGLAPCSVSISLCRGDKPLLGVIGEFPSCKLASGGADIGAIYLDKSIQVSSIDDKKNAVICTGFPSRFEFDLNGTNWINKTIAPFGKIRMFGAASLSLLNVARGAAEVYAENDIMIWDVAAGLAILEGAGGVYNITQGHHPDALNVFASNGLILDN
jgi:myo-inositol-1(or 4)-monophosphatase